MAVDGISIDLLQQCHVRVPPRGAVPPAPLQQMRELVRDGGHKLMQQRALSRLGRLLHVGSNVDDDDVPIAEPTIRDVAIEALMHPSEQRLQSHQRLRDHLHCIRE